jgi:arginine decarboxylase
VKPTIKKKSTSPIKKWSIDEAREQYFIREWGAGFFDINRKGNVAVTPFDDPAVAVDLKELVDDIVERGIDLPILVRFTDILKRSVERINECFANAIKEMRYKGRYRGVYPIKVNHSASRRGHRRFCRLLRLWLRGRQQGRTPHRHLALPTAIAHRL